MSKKNIIILSIVIAVVVGVILYFVLKGPKKEKPEKDTNGNPIHDPKKIETTDAGLDLRKTQAYKDYYNSADLKNRAKVIKDEIEATWITDEDKIYASLTGLNKMQITALKDYYANVNSITSLETFLQDGLDEDEYSKARNLIIQAQNKS